MLEVLVHLLLLLLQLVYQFALIRYRLELDSVLRLGRHWLLAQLLFQHLLALLLDHLVLLLHVSLQRWLLPLPQRLILVQVFLLVVLHFEVPVMDALLHLLLVHLLLLDLHLLEKLRNLPFVGLVIFLEADLESPLWITLQILKLALVDAIEKEKGVKLLLWSLLESQRVRDPLLFLIELLSFLLRRQSLLVFQIHALRKFWVVDLISAAPLKCDSPRFLAIVVLLEGVHQLACFCIPELDLLIEGCRYENALALHKLERFNDFIVGLGQPLHLHFMLGDLWYTKHRATSLRRPSLYFDLSG